MFILLFSKKMCAHIFYIYFIYIFLLSLTALRYFILILMMASGR